MTDGVDLAAAIASGLGAVISLGSAVVTVVLGRTSARLERAGLRQNYFVELRAWSDEVCLAMSESIHLCDLDPGKVVGESLFDRRHRLRVAFSSLIDRGRWFFPNIQSDHGGHKPVAFQGYRHEVLEWAVAYYSLLQQMDYRSQPNNVVLRTQLVDAKRRFVSLIQQVLDPRTQTKEFGLLLNPV